MAATVPDSLRQKLACATQTTDTDIEKPRPAAPAIAGLLKKTALHNSPHGGAWDPQKHPRGEHGHFAAGQHEEKKPAASPEHLVRSALDALPSDLRERAGHVIDQQDALQREGKTTDQLYDHMTGQPGAYTAERTALHTQIVNEYMKQYEDVPREGRLWVMGGLGGAGKSSLLKAKGEEFGFHAGGAVVIDPDAMKSKLLEHGAAPGYGDLTHGELTMQLHEESSHLANLTALRAMAEGRNILFDVTGADGKATKVLNQALGHPSGAYTRDKSTLVFVDVPVRQSIESALKRWQGGEGRFVHPGVIAANVDPGGAYHSVNRRHFEEQRAQYGHSYLYDNTSRPGAAYPQRRVNAQRGNLTLPGVQTKAVNDVMPDSTQSQGQITAQIQDYVTAGKTPAARDALITFLQGYHFETPEYAVGPMTDAASAWNWSESAERYTPNSWDEVNRAWAQGLLSDDDLVLIRRSLDEYEHGS